MRWPGHIASGGVVNDFTESIDVPPTITEVLGAERFSLNQGQSLAPYLTGKRPPSPRQSIFSEYLENEEACVRTSRWKFIQCSGKRLRTDGYRTDNPTPGRYVRLYDLQNDPGEFSDVSAKYPEAVQTLSAELLKRFRSTHPEASQEPSNLAVAEAIDWYLRPRDAKPHMAFY
jgi:arylsulfatase A-like enzyme